MLGYCSKVITELNDEAANKLIEDLLLVLKDFSPTLHPLKKSSPLFVVELLDWETTTKFHKRSPSVCLKKITHTK
jgi:hypothetical protein